MLEDTRSLKEVKEELRTSRELLERVELGMLSGVAAALAAAADSLAETVERLERMAPKQWMTPDEAARYLGKSKSALWEICSNEGVPRHYLSPKVIYFNRAELDEWLMSR